MKISKKNYRKFQLQIGLPDLETQFSKFYFISNFPNWNFKIWIFFLPSEEDSSPATRSNLAVSPCFVFRQFRKYRITTTTIGQIITKVNNRRVGSKSSDID